MRVLGLLLFVACTTGVWAGGTSGSIVRDLSGTTMTAVQIYDEVWRRTETSFKDSYEQALRDQETTITVSDFKRDFLPYLQRALLHASVRTDVHNPEFKKKLHESLSSLPQDEQSIYELHADVYGNENYLNQWTSAELNRLGVAVPEELRLDSLKPIPNFADITSSTLDDAAKKRIKAETESHIHKQGVMQNTRRYLLAWKLADEIKFTSPEAREEFLERNRQHLLILVRPEHRSFAEEVIRKTTK